MSITQLPALWNECIVLCKESQLVGIGKSLSYIPLILFVSLIVLSYIFSKDEMTAEDWKNVNIIITFDLVALIGYFIQLFLLVKG